LGQNDLADQKKSPVKVKREYPNKLKRSLKEFYNQAEVVISNKSEKLESELETQIQEIKGSTIKLKRNQRDIRKSKKERPQPFFKFQSRTPRLDFDMALDKNGLLTSKEFQNIQEDYKEESTISKIETPLPLTKFVLEPNAKQVEENKNLFYASYKEDKQEINKSAHGFPILPIQGETIDIRQARKDFVYDLNIITNQNQKEVIKVSFPPGKFDVFGEIPNPMNKEARQSFYRQFNFKTEHRSGYAPIDVQDTQEKEFSYKNHFIKK